MVHGYVYELDNAMGHFIRDQWTSMVVCCFPGLHLNAKWHGFSPSFLVFFFFFSKMIYFAR